MVIVEDEKDIPAFADFEAPAGTAETSAPPPSAPAPAPAGTAETSAPPPSAPAPAPAGTAETSAPPPSAPAPAPAPAAPELASAAPTPAAAPKPSGRVFASPLARKLAAEKGYDISLIKGTGPNGRIVAEDVETYKPTAAAAAASSSPAAPSPAASSPDIASAGSQAGSFDFHISPQSAAIAARLTYSMQTAPHYYLTVELALEAALELLDKLNSSLEPEEIISVTDLFVKASASATTAVPAVNASWLADAGIIRSYERFDLNLVVGHCEGLVAPAIIDVQRLGLGQIAKETKAALAALEDDSAESKPYTCGTFSLINLGAFGVSSAATIVPSPQACALSLGTIENKLVPADTESGFAVKPVLVATLSADHRVVDGAVGAQWLQALKNLIETPHNLLL